MNSWWPQFSWEATYAEDEYRSGAESDLGFIVSAWRPVGNEHGLAKWVIVYA